MTKMLTRSVLMTTLSLTVLAGCGTPNNLSSPQPSSTVSAQPSGQPSNQPSTQPSSQPSTQPSANPSTQPSGEPSTDPNDSTPSAGPSDVSVGEKTTFNGKVYDDTNAPLDGVTVKAKSLSSSVSYEETTTTAGGAYAFNNAPAGIQMEIVASKDGFTTRRRVEVLKSNKDGNPDANRYDFGTDGPATTTFGVEYNGLSDKPEIIAITPARNGSGIQPNTTFVMKFSEPMDRATVINNFGVYGGTTETLSVDTVAPTIIQGFSDAFDVTPAANSLVWDKSAFTASWGADDTELTMTFKAEQRLPTDKESDKVPDYRISMLVQDGQIKDKNGTTRAAADGGYFKTTDGNFEGNSRFSIQRDQLAPGLDSIQALTGENGNILGDEIKVVYSEPMVYYIVPGQIRGNMNGADPTKDALSPANYFISVNGGVEQSLAVLGGVAQFDTEATHKTVNLRMFGNLYSPGDQIKLRVATTVVDPAGNSLDSSQDDESVSAS